MAGLGDTVARLAKARRKGAASHGAGGDAGMAEVRGFGFNPGALRMLVHAPERLAPGAPLVVVLHGCTQRAGAYARDAGWLALADQLGFAVLAPEQTAENNPNRCFNWFAPADIARGSGETASIVAMVQHAVTALGCDPARVFVTGLSAGGAMTAALLALHPEVFAGGAVVAGLPFGLAHNVREAFGAMQGGTRLSGAALAAKVRQAGPAGGHAPRLSIWHGSADGTVAPANAAALARQWASLSGLAEAADAVETRPGWTRSIWRGEGGLAQVEVNLLAGLGHGTPISAAGEAPLGAAAPFVLEAGVSSTLEIARFWGLAPAAAEADAWRAAAPSAQATAGAGAGAAGDGVAAQVMAAVSAHVPQDVQDVIERALSAAGLRR